MQQFKARVAKFLRDEEGLTTVEYAIAGGMVGAGAIAAFNLLGIHPYDIGAIVDKMGIAVRTGHHCTQPVMEFFQIPGTVRASFAFYNTTEEIDALAEAVKKAQRMLS